MRYGCRYGNPHDLMAIGENPQMKWEVCVRCNKKFRWKKGYKGRVDNVEYLKAHVRQFAQSFGATKRIFNKLYRPENCVINL